MHRKTSADGTQVFLRFSEALSSTDFGSLSISISSGSGVTGAPTSATINNGNRVTVTHTGVVTEDSGVSLTISANAVKDLVGNTFNQRRFVPITNNARVPVAPTTLTATAASTTKINLSWSAPSDAAETNVTGYKIEVSTDAGNNWTDLVADTNSTDTKYAHTGLEPDDTRHYRVSAINAVGASPVSNVVSATTLRVNPVVSSGGRDPLRGKHRERQQPRRRTYPISNLTQGASVHHRPGERRLRARLHRDQVLRHRQHVHRSKRPRSNPQ